MLLRSLRRWSSQKYIFFRFSTTFSTPRTWKRNNDFVPIATTLTTSWFWQKKYCFVTTLTTPWLWQKIKLFLIPTVLSLHNYHKDEICFAIDATFATPWSWQKINLFSFQHYFHYTIVIRIKLLHNYHEKKTAVFFPSVNSVVLKDPCMIHQFNRQKFQWRARYFLP